MTLESEVLDSLEDLKYPDFETIEKNISLLKEVPTFSLIISWISNQLQKLNGLESVVNPIKDESQMVSFKIELNSLLRELKSPLIESDLYDTNVKLYLLNSLCGQLMASLMCLTNQKSSSNESMTISMNESQTAKDLKYILITLGEKSKPPNDVSPQLLFNRIKELLKKRLSEEQNNSPDDSLLLPDGITLSPEQWKTLEALNEELKRDYSIRRQMLVKRFDTTINSFSWKTDNKSDEHTKTQINETIGPKRKQMTDSPNITIADALAVRQSDSYSLINAVVSKNPTNCMIRVPDTKGMANKGLQQRLTQELHKYRIGAVPDRGGRPNEQPKPPKESFAQQQNQRDNPQRGRGRGGNTGAGSGSGRGGGGRDGAGHPDFSQNTNRIQGSGWAQNSGDRYSDNQRNRNYNQSNYQNDGQQYRQRNDYQQNTGYQQNSGYQQSSGYQQKSGYQQQYPQQTQQNWKQNPNDGYQYEQQYNKQSYNNYSDQSYDNSGQYYQNKSYRGRGGSGGSGRRY